MYVSQRIRGQERELPEKWFRYDPLPLSDYFFNQQYDDFRYRVWRSLLEFEKAGVTYQYIDAYRLVEIFLDKDDEFKKVRDLQLFDLVIVIMGRTDLPNRMLPPLMMQLLEQRKMEGKPTWVYCHLAYREFAERYSRDLALMLNMTGISPGAQEISKEIGTVVDPRSI